MSSKLAFVLEDTIKFEFEDGGSAAIGEVGDPNQEYFVRIHSWTQSGHHEIVDLLDGKRVRVTVEVIDVFERTNE